MKKEIIDHVKKLKEQGADVKVDEDQIVDLINKIYEKNERKTYIESQIDKFLEKYGDNKNHKNHKSDSDASKKCEGLKILTNKQMLNRLPILLAQIEAEIIRLN